jgi:type VI protein secretion system component VasF
MNNLNLLKRTKTLMNSSSAYLLSNQIKDLIIDFADTIEKQNEVINKLTSVHCAALDDLILKAQITKTESNF